jgi:CBS domain-containing protein
MHPNRTLLVSDVMMGLGKFPVVSDNSLFKDALDRMDQMRLGIACVVCDQNILLGVLTDGDLRRKLLSIQKPLSALFMDDAIKHSIASPLTIGPEATLYGAVEYMGKHGIWDLPVVLKDNKLVGLLHLHPAILALMKEY